MRHSRARLGIVDLSIPDPFKGCGLRCTALLAVQQTRHVTRDEFQRVGRQRD